MPARWTADHSRLRHLLQRAASLFTRRNVALRRRCLLRKCVDRLNKSCVLNEPGAWLGGFLVSVLRFSVRGMQCCRVNLGREAMAGSQGVVVKGSQGRVAIARWWFMLMTKFAVS